MQRLLLISLIVFLSACQQHHPFTENKANVAQATKQKPARSIKQDGPPENPEATIEETVVPMSEPLSRYGNPDIYQVDGKSYEVLTSSDGYKAKGLASWYGTKFHKKRTSSGEEYNLYALTAAHKTLPLPTYVHVKNLNNGKEAIVKVNDRGPFHDGRIIDLSYGAAVKLGMLPQGTAPVEIEALTPVNAKPKVAHYYLQAGAFSSENHAQQLKNQMAKLTPSPVFIEKYQSYFVVKAGPLANKKVTDQLKGLLASNGVAGAFSLLQ